MTTKNLLKHPEVKDIVTKAVTGVDCNAYTQLEILNGRTAHNLMYTICSQG